MSRKEEVIAIGYKIFIILAIISQIYLIIFKEINTFTLITSGVLAMYLVFRFYMLIKLARDAKKLQVPFTQFIKMGCKGCCKECKCRDLNSDSFEVIDD